ncbi:MAG: acyltransferase domain-containing protein, partial [Bauldia sp.]|nr:acyltransferase domain-containing protein [Bauldia sp.]
MNAIWQEPKAEAPKVAIVGMAAMFPGETGTTGFWRTIARGEDAIGDVPPHYWRIDDYYDPDPAAPDRTYCKRGGFLGTVAFDTLRFGVPPSAMQATDTAQLLALMTAAEVLDGVGQSQATPVDRSRTSVVLGVASATELCVHMGSRLQRPVWANALREAGLAEDQVTALCDRISDHFVPWQEATFPGLLGNVVAGRIANRLDLGGANFVTDAACASSMSALQVGLSQLYLGDSDLVIAGGVDALNDILMFMCFSKTPAFSRSGDCRPFSDQADGTILGEGAAMFALRRLEDAERDGNAIYAVIRGLGAASDGKATSVYAPRPEGQALAIERAYAAAGIDPGTVGMIEAHGTGTKAGDAAEFAGLSRVFGAARPGHSQWCALGSVKSQIGHTKAAAGSAGLFKAAMALHHKVLPPTLKVERPNPKLDIEESAFYLNTELRPWISGGRSPRRAAVSSFGFGGSNFHVVLEEYAGTAKRAPKRRHHDSELVLVSAPDRTAMDAALARIAERAEQVDISRVATESHATFDPSHACRASFPVASAARLREMVVEARTAAAGTGASAALANGGRIEFTPAAPGRVALLFPGQGSQYVGMGGPLAAAFDVARGIWDSAADRVKVDGVALHDVVFPLPVFAPEARAAQEARLTRMTFAQPAIAAVEAAALAVLARLGITGDCYAGHSFGEVMALHAGGAYGADTALGVAAERGRLMAAAAASSEGAMIAVGLGRDQLARLVAELGLDVVVANDNSPDQVVLSGGKAAVAAATAALKSRGLNVVELPVATGFHSPIVAASCAPFEAFLADQKLGAPIRPVYANATAAPYTAAAGGTGATLSAQLGQPVRFRETIERMYADGVRTFVEVGPGSVLTNLVRQCLGDRPHRAVSLDRKGAKVLLPFWQGLGEMAVAGVPMNLAALWEEAPAEPEVKRPSGAHVFAISGVNVGKPYPARAVEPAAVAAAPVPVPPVEAAPTQVPPSMPEPAITEPKPATDGLAAFQARLDARQASLEASLLEAHRAYLDASRAAFVAAQGGEATEIVVPSRSATVPDPAPVEPVLTTVAPTAAPVAAATAAVATAPDVAMLALVASVVAEKTGYPAEVLGADMDLEAELGIDSIKQVEILSALREKMPDLPELEPSALARYRTIAMIAGMLGGTPAAVKAVDVPPPPPPAA